MAPACPYPSCSGAFASCALSALVFSLRHHIYVKFELSLWLVDRAETGSIPQDIAELGSSLHGGRASERAFAHLRDYKWQLEQ